MKSGTLVIIEGRVLARQGARCVVEHKLGSSVPPGSCWRGVGGGLLETLGAQNPTEVVVIARTLPAPEVGEVLERSGDVRLRLEGGRGQLGSASGWPLMLPPVARPIPEPGGLVWTGLPGVDLLAPVRTKELLGFLSDTREGLGACMGTWASAARQSGRRVVWAGPSRWLEQVDPGDIVLTAAEDAPGGLASLARQVATVAAALAAEGTPVALALEDLGAWVGAWAEADGQSFDARSVAPRAIMDALRGALTCGDVSGALTLGDWGAGGALSSTASVEVQGELGAWVELEEGRLLLGELRGLAEGAALSARHAAVAASTRELLAAAVEVDEFEGVFGAGELSEAQQALRALAAGLEEVLGGVGGEAVELQEVLERCVGVIRG